jgi:4'-phosphopantetheinyl transferase
MLSDAEAHLWHVRPETITADREIESCRRVLVDDEVQQIARFRFDVERHDRLVARALLRTVLSTYLDVDPRDWRFESNAHGRPEVAAPAAGRGLSFSVSHTRGLIVCLVARDRVVGVDTEPLNGRRSFDDIPARYFAAAEVAELATWPAETRQRRFVEYWTLKEAYVKARGLGLSLPLRQFAFDLRAMPDTIGIAFDPEFDDEPSRWQFSFEPLSAGHVVATAMARRPRSELRAREWRLLRGA